jgi:hypothetical protein
MLSEQIQKELAEIQEMIKTLNDSAAYATAQADKCRFEASIILDGIKVLAETEIGRCTAELSFLA